jgi:hypothetical protein
VLAQHPPEQIAREVERRLALHEDSRRAEAISAPQRKVWLAPATAALAAIALWIGRDAASPLPPVHEQVAERGLRPHLIVYRKTARGAERLTDKAPVRSGELLQLAYVSAGRKYGVVASIDGRGTITFHLPERADTAASLQQHGQSALAYAFELDDTPGTERFLFVTANEPFPTQRVSEALRQNTKLDSAYTVHELALQKVP